MRENTLKTVRGSDIMLIRDTEVAKIGVSAETGITSVQICKAKVPTELSGEKNPFIYYSRVSIRCT